MSLKIKQVSLKRVLLVEVAHIRAELNTSRPADSRKHKNGRCFALVHLKCAEE